MRRSGRSPSWRATTWTAAGTRSEVLDITSVTADDDRGESRRRSRVGAHRRRRSGRSGRDRRAARQQRRRHGDRGAPLRGPAPGSPRSTRSSASDRRVHWRADGRDRQHQPVQERHAHRGRRRAVADRRVPARQAGEGRRVRAHEAEGARVRRRRRPDVPGGREVPARPHRGEERPVPVRRRRRRRLHGRGELRADAPPARVGRGRARVPAAVQLRAASDGRRQACRACSCRRRSS